MTDFAILWEPSSYSMAGKVMGRQSTGASFLKAIADARLPKFGAYCGAHASAQDCATQIAKLGAPRTGIAWVPYAYPERLKEFGLLHRPDPGIGQHAWHRLARANPRDYSLTGITHTICSPGPMSAFLDYLVAPTESWDAVICTSTVARDAVAHVLERGAEHFRERFGAQRFSLPQLPVIPLGIHTSDFTGSAAARAAARARLGLEEDEVAVLFAGRLMFHGKAHPLPMYVALEQAARSLTSKRKLVLIQAGRAPNDEVLAVFNEDPKRFCPSVRVLTVDGGDSDLYRAAWSAADIFTSLSDNIQETFGLTPVEAMAAGLPCVVSDWNGYRDTVRDGIDGIRVPTLTMPPDHGGIGGDLADRHEMSAINFDDYGYWASQLVAVDVDATAQAFVRLIDDPELRARMGAAGAERARRVFDWSVIFPRYRALWAELAERRRSDPQINEPLTRRRRPDRDDPFAMFAHYPTHHVGPGMSFRVRPGLSASEAASRRELASTKSAQFVQPSPELIADLLNVIGGVWTPYAQVLAALPEADPRKVAAGLVWLGKVGVLDFRKDGE